MNQARSHRSIKTPAVSPSGLIDVHSHLLPGIDDGCRTVEESTACMRMLVDHGFTGTVCTSHVWRAAFPENTPAKIAEQVAVLQELLRAAGLEYQLSENADSHATASGMRFHEVSDSAYAEAFGQFAKSGKTAVNTVADGASRRGLSAIPLLALLALERVAARNSRRANKEASAIAPRPPLRQLAPGDVGSDRDI